MTARIATPSTEHVTALPKVELHCHLEGSVPAATTIRLAAKNGVELPTTDPDRLYEFTSLETFLVVYGAVCRAMATADDFAAVTYESLADGARTSNLVYREMAFNPTNHSGIALGDMIAAVRDGARSAEADFGVQSRLLVAINREQPADVAVDLIKRTVEIDDPFVVGIAMDSNELLGPPEHFAEAYAIATSAGLHRTAHAGERGNVAEVWTCIDLLGVERIDHGYAALLDPELIAHSRDLGVHYAACWTTAQFHTGAGRENPIGPMVAAGLSVSVSSDDPPLIGTDVGREFSSAVQQCGWTAQEARRVMLDSAANAFLPEAERAGLVARVNA